MARLKLNIASFYEMTPIELHFAYKYINQQDESLFKLEYEVARYTVKHLWNMQGRHMKKLLGSPRDVEIFPWEEKEIKQPQSLEEMKSIIFGIHSRLGKDRKKKKPNKPTK